MAKRISAIIALDGEKEFNQSVRNVNKELTNLKSQGKLLKEEFNGQANSLKALSAKHENLIAVLKKQREKQQEVEKGLKNANDCYQKQGAKLSELKTKYQEAQKKLDELKKSETASTKETKNQEKQVESLKQDVKAAGEEYQNWANRIQGWETRLNNAKADIEKTNRQISENASYLAEAEKAADKCATSIDEYGKKTRTAEKEAKKFNEAVNVLAFQAVAQGVAAGAEVIKDAIVECSQAAEEFEASLATVSTIADTSITSMDEIQTSILELSSETGQAASDLADATYNAISASVDTANAVSFVGDANKLAVGGLTDTTTAVDVLTTAINAYGMATDEATHVSDVLVTTQNLGKTTVGEVAQSIGKVIPKASAYNMSIENVAAAYADMTANGIATAESGTYLTSMLTELAKNGSNVANVLEEQTGKGFAELMEAGYSLGDVLEIIGGSVGGNATEFSNLWSSTEAATGALSIFNAGADHFNEILGEMQDSTGATEEAFQKITTTTEYTKQKMVNAIGNVKIAIGEQLNESLKPLYEGIETAAEWANKLIKKHPEIVASIEGIAVGTVALTVALGGLTILEKINQMLSAFGGALKAQPIILVTSALIAAVTAIMAYKNAVEQSGENYEFVQNIKSQREELDSLTDSLKENQKQREENTDSVEAEYLSYQNMAGMLYELAAGEEEAASKKEKMQVLVDQLNEAMPGLNLAIDEQTGALNMEKGALDEVIEAMKQKALASAMEEKLTEAMKDQATATLEVEKAEKQKAELDEKIQEAQNKIEKSYEETTKTANQYFDTVEDSSGAYGKAEKSANQYFDTVEDAQPKVSAANQNLKEMQEESEKLAESIAAGKDTIADCEEEIQGCMEYTAEKMEDADTETSQLADTTEGATDAISDAYQEMRDSIASSLDDVVSLFDEFDGGQEVTTEDMMNNLQSQIDGLKNWKENMILLAGQTGAGMSDSLYQYLAEMGPQGANAVEALAEALRKGDGEFEQICQEWEDAISLEESLPGLVTQYYDAGTNLAEGLKKGIQDKAGEVAEASSSMTLSAIHAAKNVAVIKSPSHVFREEIGQMMAKGMASGLTDGKSSVKKSAAELCKSALEASKDSLEIRSPSKKFKNQVGFQIVNGIAVGITSKKGTVKSASEEVTKVLYDSAQKDLKNLKSKNTVSLQVEKDYWSEVKKTLKNGTKEYESASETIRNLSFSITVSKKGNFGISKTDADGAVKSASKYSSEVLSAATSWFSSYQKQHDTTVEQEVVFWQNIRKQLKKGTAAYKEATQNIKTAQKSVRQEKLSASDKALTQYKTYYNVSAKAEMQYWNIVRKQFKKGTDERIEADQKYYEAKENYNSQLEELNEDYVKNCQEVQDQLKEDIQDLTDAYTDAVKERAESIYDSVGLFDEFSSESESGEKLLYNLKTQVAGIADWEVQLQELASRGLSTDLIEELQEMGPEASASLHALNSLTDKELKEYEDLWQTKHDLADSQAVKELESVRKETQQEITELKNTAQSELNQLKADYKAACAEVNTGISSALKSLANSTKKIGTDATAALVNAIKTGAESKDTSVKLESAATTVKKGLGTLPAAGKTIGTNTLKGIVNGLNNTKQLSASAKTFVENLKKEIQKAAGIHSPSRLFKKEIGVQLSAGIAEGITDESTRVNQAGAELISELLANAKKDISMQQAELGNYLESVNSGAGLTELNNLISVAPVQQVNATVDNSGLVSLFEEMLQVMQEGFYQIGNMQLVTDTGALVGELSSGMSSELARMSRRIRG